jgi:hypothetical protein
MRFSEGSKASSTSYVGTVRYGCERLFFPWAAAALELGGEGSGVAGSLASRHGIGTVSHCNSIVPSFPPCKLYSMYLQVLFSF